MPDKLTYGDKSLSKYDFIPFASTPSVRPLLEAIWNYPDVSQCVGDCKQAHRLLSQWEEKVFDAIQGMYTESSGNSRRCKFFTQRLDNCRLADQVSEASKYHLDWEPMLELLRMMLHGRRLSAIRDHVFQDLQEHTHRAALVISLQEAEEHRIQRKTWKSEDTYFTVVEVFKEGHIRPVLYARTIHSFRWRSCENNRALLVNNGDVYKTPEEAINNYVALTRTYLERQADELVGTHYIKEPKA